MIDSELGEVLPGRRAISIRTVLKRCKANAMPTPAKPVLVGNAQDKEQPLRLRSAYSERRRKLDVAMIKGYRRLCAVTWEEVDFGKLVSERR